MSVENLSTTKLLNKLKGKTIKDVRHCTEDNLVEIEFTDGSIYKNYATNKLVATTLPMLYIEMDIKESHKFNLGE